MPPVSTEFFTRTREAWNAMLADIEKATISIDIEQYIFSIDEIGSRFLNAIIDRARAGVKVRLLCDAVGSYTFYRSQIPKRLAGAGIQVLFFNPISPWRIANFTSHFFRDHRKIMVVDNAIGHLGGVGIQDHMADWRDTHMRMMGPVVADIKQSFETVWNIVAQGKLMPFKKSKQFIKRFNVQTNSPRLGQRFIYQALISNIRNAKRYIYLTTPYFIPDVRLFRVLQLAAKRGVDVRLIIPGITDHLFINHARESYFSLALKAGIRIYIYKPVMMHTKTAVIDDEWATAGSFNLDNLSFTFNHEANISTSDPQFIHEIKHQFLEDLKSSVHLNYEEWIRRPLRKKFLEFLTWPFHPIM